MNDAERAASHIGIAAHLAEQADSHRRAHAESYEAAGMSLALSGAAARLALVHVALATYYRSEGQT